MRSRNKLWYRVAHWPIWIWVFFLTPGPLTFDLFAAGPSRRNFAWLLAVLVATGVAGVFGRLPGVEPKPYILKFSEEKANPLYRRICYTFAWNALLNFAALNLIGLVIAVETRTWRLRQVYNRGYLPIFVLILGSGLLALLPRVKRSTAGEGIERRYFYSTVWAVTAAQTVLLILWKTLPRTHAVDVLELTSYMAVLGGVGVACSRGMLPRTRPILPGELMVAD